MANDIRIRAWVKDEVTGALGKIQDKFDNLGKSKGFQNIVQGVGLGIGIQAWNYASGQIVDAIGDAIDAAKEEEVSIQKLGSALKANIPAWDGNTDAIERVLKARMKLGFSDDEQRDSLAKLVAATHDAAKALDIQRVAMDLARFKGISLADATDALTKVEAGSYRILKSLGIVLKDGATQTEALAAVQKVAAGQAADYAETNTGKLLVSQVKVNEAMEKFGTAILPAVAEVTSSTADAITGFTAALDVLGGNLPKTASEVRDTEDGFIDLAKAIGILVPASGLLSKAMEANTSDVSDSVETMRDNVDWSTGKAANAIGDVGDAAKDMAKEAKSATQRTADYFKTLRENLVDDTSALIDDVFDPIEKKLEAEGNHFRILADIQERESAKGKEAVNAANSSIISDLDDQAQTLLDLGKRGKLTRKQVEQFADDSKAAFASMGKKVPRELQKVIDKLLALEGFDGNHIRIGIDISQRMGIGGKVAGKKHADGFVGTTKGATLTDVGWMGEAGTEAYAILRNPKKLTSGDLGGIGGSTITVNVMSSGVLTPGQGQAIAREIGPYLRDYTARRG